jgi:long-chain acyl-CoA synthetase
MLPPETLQELLSRMTERGEAPAIVSIGDGRPQAVSFSQLDDGASRVAEAVLSFGPWNGGAVGLMAPNGAAWIAAFWGIVRAGQVAMPIDAQIGDDDLRRMLAVGDCRLLLAARGQMERLSALQLRCAVMDIAAPAPCGARGAFAARVARPDDVAVLAFTSGTTGTPKAVPLTHANLLSNVRAILAEKVVGPEDRAVVPLPLHHTYPLTVGMLAVLASGATMILPAGLSGPQLLEALRQGRATALLGVPRLYGALLANIRAAAARRPQPAKMLFPLLLAIAALAGRCSLPLGRWLFRSLRAQLGPSLRLLVSGGAALATEDEAALRALGWELLTGYGLTETSPILTFNRPGRPRIGSAGQALPGISLRIADPEADGTGEVQAKGASVFAGYRHDAAATGAAFTADGWFRTGDLGRLDAAGYLTIVARATETIVLPNGKKVYPETLEAAYADPVIREIAVLRRGDALVGLVVPNEEALREAGAFRLHDRISDALRMRARTLPPYLRLGGFAVTRAPLPRTQLGKIRRHLLPPIYERAQQAGAPAPPPAASAQDAALLDSPRAAAVLAWLRARHPDRPVAFDTSPQLDLGIDSLGWIDLTLAIEREFGVALSEAQIARIVTVADLLREIVATAPVAEPPKAAVERPMLWLAPHGPGLRALRAVGETLLRAVMRAVFRLRVEGRERLPAPPFMICPNHVSYLDAFALAVALPHRRLRETYWTGWTGLLFSNPLVRLFSRVAQVVPIDPDRAVAAGIEMGGEVLARGKNLVWFPEGILSPDGSLQPFQPGVGAVLERRAVPVVPVYIDGTADALPLGKKVPRLHPVTVRFGPPIDASRVASDLSGRERQQRIADVIRAAVAALAADVPRRMAEAGPRQRVR